MLSKRGTEASLHCVEYLTTLFCFNCCQLVTLGCFCSCRTLISDEKGKFDELVEEKGVKVLIDPKALMHVIGTKMDYVDDPLKYGSYYTVIFCPPVHQFSVTN